MARAPSEPRPFSYRGFVSLMVVAMFLVMSVTGIVLYIVPPGRVANWLDWRLLMLSKDEWAAVHIASSLIFVAAGLMHLVNNIKPLMHYMRQRMTVIGRPRPKALAAFTASALIVAGTIADVPPFSYLMQVNEMAKGMWSVEASTEPPFNGAEHAELGVLAERMRLVPEQLTEALAAGGIAVAEGDTLATLGSRTGLSPAALHAAILGGLAALEPDGPAWLHDGVTPEEVKARFGDSGAGRKTVAQVAQEVALPVEVALARLAALGLDARPDSRMRALGETAGIGATDLIAAIVIEGYRPGLAAAAH